ncbi:MAG: hypothetical protein RMZ43_009230 [Nostoc sp. CmiVER01]|uniref:hypothetical protein n=1 Tax=Nostoc sp. CmiVER01 TaxID=3075384 RepID=UPI002AD26816|nr:hypothetical protein [Nostoc sp. CmiVER01]MDZ8123477.1 hypothetical protein [Nostoc sp. CmiVER01]
MKLLIFKVESSDSSEGGFVYRVTLMLISGETGTFEWDLIKFYPDRKSEIFLNERPCLSHLGRCILRIYLSLHTLVFSRQLTYVLLEEVRWRCLRRATPTLPGDFPAWQTVYTYFRNWRNS